MRLRYTLRTFIIVVLAVAIAAALLPLAAARYYASSLVDAGLQETSDLQRLLDEDARLGRRVLARG